MPANDLHNYCGIEIRRFQPTAPAGRYGNDKTWNSPPDMLTVREIAIGAFRRECLPLMAHGWARLGRRRDNGRHPRELGPPSLRPRAIDHDIVSFIREPPKFLLISKGRCEKIWVPKGVKVSRAGRLGRRPVRRSNLGLDRWRRSKIQRAQLSARGLKSSKMKKKCCRRELFSSVTLIWSSI